MDAIKAIEMDLKSEVERFQKTQKAFNNLVETRKKLTKNLNDRKSAVVEIDMLKGDVDVYRSSALVLVKHDFRACRQYMVKRINHIKKELRQYDEQIEELQKQKFLWGENLLGKLK